jgi:two-component system, NarL family, response regulator YdfI
VIRLIIVARSPVVRAGLESLSGSHPELRLAGSFPDFTNVEDIPADVLLAACSIPEIPLPAQPLPAVVLTADEQPAWTVEAIKLGVRALLPRNASQEQILAAILAAASGLATIHPEDLDALAGASVQTVSGDDVELTPRELEVLRMMADGAANKTIAWKLGISEHTVKFHVASILARLGAGTRTEAVTMGIRRGWIMV